MKLMLGDCLKRMSELPDNSVDSIVTDPPYGISFMAKKWDYDVPSVEVWQEAMRVLKPGGHALIACGTRTQHRMVVNIEDAGFEIRDVVSFLHSQKTAFNSLWESLNDEQRKLYGSIHQDGNVTWGYGSGFPKSHNVSKAIDKAAGAEREVVGSKRAPGKPQFLAANNGGINSPDRTASSGFEVDITAPATDEAKQWDGWGSALKPSCEFFTLARKPLSEKTIAKNVLKWGTGGINIDGCRVGTEERENPAFGVAGWRKQEGRSDVQETQSKTVQGRFPANLIHDGSQQVLELFPETKPSRIGKPRGTKKKGLFANSKFNKVGQEHNDSGSAARFFYCAKASKRDRDEGNFHPTVKPTALMRYLCRLITPEGGTILDPYMGSGSTGKGAMLEGFDFIGCELDADYFEIAKARIENAHKDKFQEQLEMEAAQ